MVRAAEAVRDGKALAMVTAGNTGAAMASALLRMGRLQGVVRPAIVTPIPHPGWPSDRAPRLRRQRRVHAAHAGAVRPDGRGLRRQRYGIDQPRVALLSIGEEKSKGTPLVKETHDLLPRRRARHSTSWATSRAATSSPGRPT